MKIGTYANLSPQGTTPEQYLMELGRHLPDFVKLIIELNNEVESLKERVQQLENRR